MNYINIHTHQLDAVDTSIVNHCKDFEQIQPSRYCSVGLHPWYIQPLQWKRELELVKDKLRLPEVVALGECGLDRVCKTDFTLQQQVFEAQVHLANENKKPLILHVVRAHEDVLKMLAIVNNVSPFIFHGFNKNITIADKILDAGGYLSFGKAVHNTHVADIVKNIDADRLFLETDDAPVSIAAIYEAVARIRNISIEALSLQIQKNTAQIFNIIV